MRNEIINSLNRIILFLLFEKFWRNYFVKLLKKNIHKKIQKKIHCSPQWDLFRELCMMQITHFGDTHHSDCIVKSSSLVSIPEVMKNKYKTLSKVYRILLRNYNWLSTTLLMQISQVPWFVFMERFLQVILYIF